MSDEAPKSARPKKLLLRTAVLETARAVTLSGVLAACGGNTAPPPGNPKGSGFDEGAPTGGAPGETTSATTGGAGENPTDNQGGAPPVLANPKGPGYDMGLEKTPETRDRHYE